MDDQPEALESMVRRAQASAVVALQPDDLDQLDPAIAAETDDGARGALLLARAIARQGDADTSFAADDSARAFDLLRTSDRVDEAALAAAAAGAMRHRAGDVEKAVDYAVEAMVLIDLAERTPAAARAANALAVLFAELSAFELAMTYSTLASDIFGHDGCRAGFAVPYTLCYISVEAHHAGVRLPLPRAHRSVAQLLASDNPVARTLLGPGMAAELAHLEHPNANSGDRLDPAARTGSAPRLHAWYGLVLARSAHLDGDDASAEHLLDDAIDTLINVGDDHRVVRALRLRSRVRKMLGDMDGALADALTVGDSVRSWHVDQVGRLAVQISQRAELEKQRSTLQREAAHLTEQVDVDALTRIGSRRLLEVRLDELAAQQGRVAVALIDVDEFKSVNDRHGHSAGDAVLRRVGEVLSTTGTTCTVLARYGGDEFVAVFAHCGAAVASTFAEAVRARLTEFAWDDISIGLDVRLSVGVADGQLPDVRAVIERADMALYSAKRLGRDRCVTA